MTSAMRLAVVGAVALMMGAADARAAIIHLLPGNVTVSPGATVLLDLSISGLGGSVVGDFDVDIGFDAAALTFQGVTLGTALGDVGAGEAIDFGSGLLSPGLVNVVEVSLLAPVALAALQSPTFSLALLEFKVSSLAAGKSTFVEIVQVNALGDSGGIALAVSNLEHSTLRRPGASAVPEPSTALLLVSGCVVFARRLRRREVASR